MISFNLVCDSAHEFEGWFSNNADFDTQQARALIACPACGSTAVAKALMAPAVSTGRRKEPRPEPASESAGAPAPEAKEGKEPVALGLSPEQRAVLEKARAIAREMMKHSENVGEKFAEEARKIHYGEAEARPIHGAATADEARELVEEEIPVMALPVLPEDRN